MDVAKIKTLRVLKYDIFKTFYQLITFSYIYRTWFSHFKYERK